MYGTRNKFSYLPVQYSKSAESASPLGVFSKKFAKLSIAADRAVIRGGGKFSYVSSADFGTASKTLAYVFSCAVK